MMYPTMKRKKGRTNNNNVCFYDEIPSKNLKHMHASMGTYHDYSLAN